MSRLRVFTWICLLASAFLALPAPVFAQSAEPTVAQTVEPDAQREKALSDACAHELAERQPGGGQGHAYTVSASALERPDDRTVRVTLSLTSGEGRLIQGTCVFRNGKLFDVRQ